MVKASGFCDPGYCCPGYLLHPRNDHPSWSGQLSLQIYRSLLYVVVLGNILTIVFFNIMHDVMKRGYAKELSATIKLVLVVGLLATAFMFFTQSGDAYSRLVILYTALLHLTIGFLSRISWKAILLTHGKLGLIGANKRSMLAILKKESAEEMCSRLLANPAEAYKLVGIVLNEPTRKKAICGIPVVSDLDHVTEYICREWIDSVYIDCDSADEKIKKVMDDCREMAIPVHYHIPGVSRLNQKQFVERIGGSTVLTLSNTYVTPVQFIAKRLMDFFGGLIGSFFALIIIAVIGPFIKKASPGPILYTSERIGQNGKHFHATMSQSMSKCLAFA